MNYIIPILLAVLALVAIYFLMARAPKMIVPTGSPNMWRQSLSIRYLSAIFWSVMSGFGIATFGIHLGWLRLVGLCLSLLLSFAIGPWWSRYHLRMAYDDKTTTPQTLKLTKETTNGGLVDGASAEMMTVPRLPAWIPFLILGTAQIMGVVAGHVAMYLK